MASDWLQMPFSQAVLVNPAVGLKRGEEYPFVDMPTVTPGARCVRAAERRVFAGGGSRFQVGDTLLARITPSLENGKIARFCGDAAGHVAHGSTEFIVIRGREGVTDTAYAYYLTKSPGVTSYAIDQMTGTSGRQRVPTEALAHLTVPIPPLHQQRSIAQILGALDDKIEVNGLMNRSLDAISHALFKSWFVDFDPVRAKAEGRDSGLPLDVAALFPDSLVNSALGPIPSGWRALPLGRVARVTVGGDWGADERFEGAVEAVCLRGVDLERLRKEGWSDAPRRWVTAASAEKRRLSDRDVLVAGSGAGPTGRPLWASPQLEDMWGLPVIYSNFCKRVRCSSSEVAVYVDRCLHVMRESGEIWEYVNGTSVPNLDADALLAQKHIIVPDLRVLRVFERLSRSVSRKLLSEESRILTTIRDALLPKLVSGETSVSDADKLLEAPPK